MSVEHRLLSDVLALLFTFAVALRIGWVTFVTLRSGVARITHRLEFPRSTEAGIFWMIVIYQSALVVVLLAVGVRGVVRLGEKPTKDQPASVNRRA